MLEPVQALPGRPHLLVADDVRTERQVHRHRRNNERRRLDAEVAPDDAVRDLVVAPAADTVDEQVATEQAHEQREHERFRSDKGTRCFQRVQGALVIGGQLGDRLPTGEQRRPTIGVWFRPHASPEVSS